MEDFSSNSHFLPCGRHYPIGLLFDLYSNVDSLPWNIILHFRDLPTDTLLLKPTPETMQDMFMAMVKEVGEGILRGEGDFRLSISLICCN